MNNAATTETSNTNEGKKMAFADYIYRNAADTIRFRIFKRYNGEWDVDGFERIPSGHWISEADGHWNFGCEAGDLFRTKRAAKEWIEENFGVPFSIQPVSDITEGWK